MKEVYIPYNNDLERTDESMITSRHVGKNLAELRLSVDSLDQRIDSINIGYGKQLVDRTYYRTVNDRKSSSDCTSPLRSMKRLLQRG